MIKAHSFSEIVSDVFCGIKTAGSLMLIQSPVVTSFNRISVVCCRYDLTTIQSVRKIFHGKIDGENRSSLKHFTKGMSGHLAKEAARLIFKSSGIVLNPRIDEKWKHLPFGKLKSDLFFASALACSEMLINPFDTVRTMWQANEKIRDIPKGKRMSHLYKGAFANGTKQFGLWFGFPLSERVWSHVLEKTTNIDPHSILGIFMKAIPQSIQMSAPVWLLERVKNELQYKTQLHYEDGSRYKTAICNIFRQQGVKGFVRGYPPKILSTSCLVIGADYLLERGRKSNA
jgi:hypothetical protein